MFLDEASFLNAFTQWQRMVNSTNPKPKKCGTSTTEMDCVPAGQLGVNAALVCNAANLNTGLCTNSNQIVPSHVAFRYLKNNDTGGVWIMTTAYPSKNPNCS